MSSTSLREQVSQLNDYAPMVAFGLGLVLLLPNVIFPLLAQKYVFALTLGLTLGVVVLGGVRSDARILLAGVGPHFIAATIFWSPVFQELVYGIIYKSPSMWYWGIIGTAIAVVGAILARRVEEPTTRHGAIIGFGIVVALVGGLLVGPAMGSVYTNEHLADQMTANTDEVNNLSTVDANNSRIAPRGVSRTRAKNSLQYSKYKLAECGVTNLNQTLHWSCPLQPDGLFNTFTGSQKGAVYIDQTTSSKSITTHDDADFEAGVGMRVTDNVQWKLSRSDYLTDYRNSYMVPGKKSSLIGVSYVEHEIKFKLFPIPQVYSVPKFGGVKLVDEDGSVEDVDADEIESHKILSELNGEQNTYPHSLARKRVKSVSYQHGFLNTMLGKDDVIELSKTQNKNNKQPFTIQTQDGLQYITSVEPAGDANGVISIYSMDAQTGEATVKHYEEDSALRGPRKAVDAIMAHPDLSRLNDVSPVEPIPVTFNDTLYWQVRIVPDSASSITYIGFFNAETEEVTLVQTTEDTRAFLTGNIEEGTSTSPESNEPNGPGNGSGDGGDSSGTVEIVIVHDDGTKETISVDSGSTIQIGNQTDGSE